MCLDPVGLPVAAHDKIVKLLSWRCSLTDSEQLSDSNTWLFRMSFRRTKLADQSRGLGVDVECMSQHTKIVNVNGDVIPRP